jgi:hypothetical protein
MLIILYNPVLQVRSTAESHDGRRATNANAQKTTERSTRDESGDECPKAQKLGDDRTKDPKYAAP